MGFRAIVAFLCRLAFVFLSLDFRRRGIQININSNHTKGFSLAWTEFQAYKLAPILTGWADR